MNFRSDNEAPVAAPILSALAHANNGTAYAYGDDAVTANVKSMFCEVFEKEVAVFPLATGTAANALALAHLVPSYGAAFCHEEAHLYTDECGAPEMYTGGAKLLPLPGKHAKIDADTFRNALRASGHLGDHEAKISALSLSQSTEFGTVYTLSEVAALAELAHASGLGMHMDGARFANALVSIGCTPADMTWKAGVDLLSFGATKNGAMGAEALIVFDPDKAAELGRRRKRGGHLLSKMRYVSVQLEAYLTHDLWLTLARQANDMAKRLCQGLEATGTELLHPVEANEVFVRMSDAMAGGLHDAGFEFHGWPGRPDVYRLVTTFATERADVDRLVGTARELNV